jgi:Transglutaminase-like superfamily
MGNICFTFQRQVIVLKYSFRLVLAASLFAAIPAFCSVKEHSQIVTVNDQTYEIEVDGFRDPVNLTIVIENLGQEPIVNPRITVDGRYDWFDVETMAREVTRGCKTDEERALAIAEFIRKNFHHLDSPGDRETHNPVVSLNVYGYANCAYHSSAFVSMCRALGIPARVWEVWLHTVSEAYYNNAWHMLDSDIGLNYLLDDNRTIASIEQLWADQKITGGKEENANLTKFSGRNKAVFMVYTDIEGNNTYLSQDGVRQRGYRYFHDDYHCYVQTGYDRFTYEQHSMAMTLRPWEKLVRNWKGGEKYYDYKRHNELYERDKKPYRKPILYGDGQLIWKPDLRSEKARLYLNQEMPPAYIFDDGQEPPVHVKRRQGGVYVVATRAIFDVETPYTILGGRLKARLYRGAATRWDRLTATVNSRTGPVKERVWSAPRGETGSIDVDLSLDEVLFPTGERGRRSYSVEFNFTANEKNDPPTQSGLEEVEFVTDIQCAPNSLPALSLGKNIIRYRDETPGEHKVKITHLWRERTDNHPPKPPQDAVYPRHGGVVDNLAPLFKWKAAKDTDRADRIEDYRITISFDPQCRWPVATALKSLTGSSKPEWKLPEGWLNRNTTYYWKVEAKDSRGIWGDCSPVFRFATK